MRDQHFYLTTTLPYVNAEPHIGFALEIVAGDVICRYHKEMLGEKVAFNTGTDEHGQKIYQEALKAKKNSQDYVDEYAAKFEELKKLLNLSYTHFIRTTNPDHKKAAQHFWQLCDTNGFIYKKNYTIKYCVGCELEKTESELVDGRCPLHPNQELETREEENYFFKFSAFEKPLLEYYQKNPDFVKPEGKMKEITAFVKGGLQDFSISRLKAKMPWGVTVPGDESQVMYVWFDALINYISTLGWPKDEAEFHQYWPGVQLAGKDNLRQQSAMWQAMLLAAGIQPSKNILINGFISIGGQKMSKSLGNVISPKEMVDRYGADATRYLLMNLGPFGTDMDVTWEKLDTTYTADLSNGLGNLCSRVAKLCEQTNFVNTVPQPEVPDNYHVALVDFNILDALTQSRSLITELDQYLTKKEPWKLEPQSVRAVLTEAVEKILLIGKLLSPFMPDTTQTILKNFSNEKIKAVQPLFPRLS